MDFFALISNKFNIKTDKQQRSAITHFKEPALVISGPGSGKTTVINARIAYLVLEKKIHPSNILTLTFNRLAKIEMENRFNNTFGTILDNRAYFSTFHSFCNLIITDYEKIKGIYYKRIEGENKNVENKRFILRNLFYEINNTKINEDELENLINEIGYAKNKMLNNFKEINFSTKNFGKIFVAYEKYKKSKLYIDFDDMLVYAHLILKKFPNIQRYYIEKYPFIQIDEGQDLSKIQFEILKFLQNKNSKNIFIVADDDQSIYGFRGSEPQYIIDINNLFNKCKLYWLENNYRSSKNIVEISSEFIKTNKNRYNKNLLTVNDKKYDPIILNPKDESEQIDIVIKIIKDKLCQRPDYDIAILYRNNLSSLLLVDALERNNINFNIKQNKLFFFNHWLVQDILAFLKFSLDQTDKESFLKICYKLNKYISRSMVEDILEFPTKINILENMTKNKSLKSFQKELINDLKLQFENLSKLKPYTALDYIEYSFKYFDSIKKYCEKTGLSYKYLYNLFGILKNLSYKYNTIADFIQRLNYLESLFEAGKFGGKYKNIKLTTLHSSKGLEFDCVIMLDLYMSEIPGQQALDSYKKGKNLELLEEERRLFYVGMTRAREHIYLIFPQNKIGHIEARSIFIDEVIKIMDKNNTYSISEGLILNHKTFGKGAIVSIKEEFSQTIIEVDFKGTRRILDLNFCIENNLLSFDF